MPTMLTIAESRAVGVPPKRCILYTSMYIWCERTRLSFFVLTVVAPKSPYHVSSPRRSTCAGKLTQSFWHPVMNGVASLPHSNATEPASSHNNRRFSCHDMPLLL